MRSHWPPTHMLKILSGSDMSRPDCDDMPLPAPLLVSLVPLVVLPDRICMLPHPASNAMHVMAMTLFMTHLMES